jgi:hypothetical protein
LRQLSFGSQVKTILVVALPTAAVFCVLLLLLELAGVPVAGRANGAALLTIVLAFALTSLILAYVIALFQIAGLALLRLLPWRGPELKIEEPRHLGTIFE